MRPRRIWDSVKLSSAVHLHFYLGFSHILKKNSLTAYLLKYLSFSYILKTISRSIS